MEAVFLARPEIISKRLRRHIAQTSTSCVFPPLTPAMASLRREKRKHFQEKPEVIDLPNNHLDSIRLSQLGNIDFSRVTSFLLLGERNALLATAPATNRCLSLLPPPATAVGGGPDQGVLAHARSVAAQECPSCLRGCALDGQIVSARWPRTE